MRAALFETFKGPITIKNISDPNPNQNGVVIKVMATGLCRSDWHGWMGHDSDIKLPHVPGHELAGVIEVVGRNVKNFKVGDRVTVPFVCGCGTCEQCSTGNQQICDHQSQPGFTHHGSFAEYVAVDYADTNLVLLPEHINDVTAATLGCRFVTSFRAIVHQAKVKENQHVVIHGCGGVGLSAVMIAKAFGARITAIDINSESLELAKELGADQVINGLSNKKIVEEIKEITHGGAHVSVDALGSAETCFNSISGLRKRGKHIQVGLLTGDHKHPKVPMDEVLANELELIGSHGMQAHKYPEMLKMIIENKLQPERLIERTIGLDDIPFALPNMNSFKNTGVLVINSF